MKTLTMRFLTLFGIALLATVMIFSFAACKHDGDGGDDDFTEIPIPVVELQNTRWINKGINEYYNDSIRFTKTSVIVEQSHSWDLGYSLRDSLYVAEINQTTLFFNFNKDQTKDHVVYRDNEIKMVNFEAIHNKTMGWTKDNDYYVSDDFGYTYTSDNTISIDYYNMPYSGPKDYTITIPSSINGTAVTSIGKGRAAFNGLQLRSVTIPESVLYIGENAFLNNRLISITIGANVDVQKSSFSGFDVANSFYDVYTENGKAAGTYKRDSVGSDNAPWTKQP